MSVSPVGVTTKPGSINFLFWMSEVEWRRNEKPEDERWEKPFVYEMRDATVLTIQQKPFHSVETIGQTVWDGCLVLCKYLENQYIFPSSHFANKRLIELGSGTGLLGIVASKLGCQQVIVSDYNCKEVLELMQLNCVQNNAATIQVLPLEWGVTPIKEQYDIILGAELIYDEELIVPLIDTINKLCKDTTIVYLSFDTHRDNEDTVELLYSEIDKYFHCEKVPLEDMDSKYRSPGITIIKLRKK